MNDSNDDFNARLTTIKDEIKSHRTSVKDSIFRAPTIIDLLVVHMEKILEDPAHAPEHGLHLLQGLLTESSKCKKASS
jgi:hypothetical protein